MSCYIIVGERGNLAFMRENRGLLHVVGVGDEVRVIERA
jgi:hypothetical protein